MDDKKGIVLSDLHSGHLAGLTPPRFRHYDPKWDRIEAELYENYEDMVDRNAPYDFLFLLGDLVDGKGSRSGGTELISTDINKQIDMAVEAINRVPLKEGASIIQVYGTPYHVGDEIDYETTISKEIKAKKIGGHEWADVNGIVFDLKHKTPSTTVPYSKATGISKERLWNYLWNEHDEQPKAHVFLRGHVHYFFFCGDSNWTGIICPPLQGQGSKYGSRQCMGHIDFGVIYPFVSKEGEFTWDYDVRIIQSQKKYPIKI